MQNQSKLYFIVLPYTKQQYFILVNQQMTPKTIIQFFEDSRYHYLYFLEENRLLDLDLAFEKQRVEDGSILYLL